MPTKITKIDFSFESLSFEDLSANLQEYLQRYPIKINPQIGEGQDWTALYYRVGGKYKWIKNIALKDSSEFEKGMGDRIETPGGTLFGDVFLQGGIVGFILFREEKRKLFLSIYDERPERQWLKPLPTGLAEWYEGAKPCRTFYRELYEEVLLGQRTHLDRCYSPPLLAGTEPPWGAEELQNRYLKFGFDIRDFRTIGRVYPYGIRYINSNNRTLETVFFWDTGMEMTKDIYGIYLEPYPTTDLVSDPLLYGEFSEGSQGLIRWIGLARKGSLPLGYPDNLQPTAKSPRNHPSIQGVARGKWLEKIEKLV